MECSAVTAISRLESKNICFDIIFMDPPYEMNLEAEVLDRLRDSSLAGENTLIIVEASLDTSFGYLEDYGFEILKTKEYKTNKHVFITRKR